MSTEFEKKFADVLASLEATPSDQLVAALQGYRAELARHSRETYTLGDVLVDRKETSGGTSSHFVFDHETIRKINEVTQVVLKAAYHLTMISAQVAQQFADALANDLDEPELPREDEYVAVNEREAKGQVPPDEMDFMFDMVA